MSESRVVTCAFCGEAYPDGTPTSGAEMLAQHIRECRKHPMRALEKKAARLRDALTRVVGASSRSELEEMTLGLYLMPDSDDKKAAQFALEVLLETAEEVER